MLIWLVTIFLALVGAFGWLILKRDPERYIHESKSPINFFFRWGRVYHHFFKVAVLVVFIIIIFSLYKYLLHASDVLAVSLAALGGAGLAGGKELLDKSIQLDDIFSSLIGILLGVAVAFLILW